MIEGRLPEGGNQTLKKRILTALCLPLLLVLTGCLFRSPEDLYRQPEKSAGYEQLNAAIRNVKTGLELELGVKPEDANILAGDNTATIQLQDLDGDGRRESAVTFLRVSGEEHSMRIYIFSQVGEEYVATGVVEGEGSAIYAIDYVRLNGEGRKELVVCWQISTGAYQVGAYTLDNIDLPGEGLDEEEAREAIAGMTRGDLAGSGLLLTRCHVAGDGSSGVLLLDMDQDTRTEIVVVRTDSSGVNSHAEMYGWEDGALAPVGLADLSSGISSISRIRSNYLAGDTYQPAIYITSTLSDGSRGIDVLAMQEGKLVNLALDENGVSRELIQGYTEVNPTDINGDYVVELPCPTALPTYGESASSNFWIIDWSQYDSRGRRSHVLTTYHNSSDGWYLELPESWRDQITLSRNDQVTGQREVVFSHWLGEEREPEPFLSIYRISSSRTGDPQDRGLFVLREEENIIYAARFHPGGWECGLSEMDLLDRFKTIRASWHYE